MTGPLLTTCSSGSTGIGEPLQTASCMPLKVCSPDRQVGKHANMQHNQSIKAFHTCEEASPAERVPLHDWDVNWFTIPFGDSQ